MGGSWLFASSSCSFSWFTWFFYSSNIRCWLQCLVVGRSVGWLAVCLVISWVISSVGRSVGRFIHFSIHYDLMCMFCSLWKTHLWIRGFSKITTEVLCAWFSRKHLHFIPNMYVEEKHTCQYNVQRPTAHFSNALAIFSPIRHSHTHIFQRP